MHQRSPTAVIDGFVPARLTIARQARGLKQNELAAAINRTPATISKWENENYIHLPDAAAIGDLASFLNVASNWFFKPLPKKSGVAFFRSLRSELAVLRDKTAAKLYFVNEIFGQLNERVEFPEVDIPDLLNGVHYKSLDADAIDRIAMSLREYWGLGDDPIEDLLLVIENAGIIVSEDYVESTKLDGVSRWFDDRPVILLAKDKDGGVRRRFDAAHELGHLILHQDVKDDELSQNIILIEEQAMLFAGSFLLPASAFSSDISDATLDVLADIKTKWKVSIGAMIKRLKSLNLVSRDHELNLWKYYSYRRWRGDEPHDQLISIERPANLKVAIEMTLEDGQGELYNLVSDIGLSTEDISALVGVDEEILKVKDLARPRLRLVRRETSEIDPL